MSPPRVEISCIRLHVFGGRSCAVGVEYEFVGGEEEATEGAFDALGSRRVISRRQESPATPPSTLMMYGERKVLGQTRRRVVPQEGLAEALGLSACDHAAASGRYWHGAGPSEYFELHRGALNASDS